MPAIHDHEIRLAYDHRTGRWGWRVVWGTLTPTDSGGEAGTAENALAAARSAAERDWQTGDVCRDLTAA